MHLRLTDELRGQIQNGRFAEGDSFPSEAELCLATGASRGTVRRALSVLRAEGLITGGRGRAPVVSHAVPSQPFTTFMSFTEWAFATGRVPGQLTREIARRPASEEAAGHLGIAAGEPVVQVLRLRLLDGEPAMVEASTFVHSVGRLLFDFDADSGSIFGFLSDAGIDLHRGRHTIDAVAATASDAALLGVDEGAPLLRERRLTYSSRGEALEYSDDRYVPALANFVIENTRETRAALVRIPTTA